MSNIEHNEFEMEEPKAIGVHTRYAFWLSTADRDLVAFVQTLTCVAGITQAESERFLVEIPDTYDADEAWHWIRSHLEEEVRFVKLDKIWEDAMAWLL